MELNPTFGDTQTPSSGLYKPNSIVPEKINAGISVTVCHPTVRRPHETLTAGKAPEYLQQIKGYIPKWVPLYIDENTFDSSDFRSGLILSETSYCHEACSSGVAVTGLRQEPLVEYVPNRDSAGNPACYFAGSRPASWPNSGRPCSSSSCSSSSSSGSSGSSSRPASWTVVLGQPAGRLAG